MSFELEEEQAEEEDLGPAEDEPSEDLDSPEDQKAAD